jgi:hypothetical protein
MKPHKAEKQIFKGLSPEARRKAAVILETLSGLRTTPEAAEALGVSTNRYYGLEQHALSGLAAACEPRKRGSQTSAEKEQARLRRELGWWKRESERYKALHRALQRTAGIPELANPRGKDKMKRRKPVVRALRAADRLKREEAPAGEAPAAAAEAPLKTGSLKKTPRAGGYQRLRRGDFIAQKERKRIDPDDQGGQKNALAGFLCGRFSGLGVNFSENVKKRRGRR